MEVMGKGSEKCERHSELDQLSSTISRPVPYVSPYNNDTLGPECPYTSHGLAVIMPFDNVLLMVTQVTAPVCVILAYESQMD